MSGIPYVPSRASSAMPFSSIKNATTCVSAFFRLISTKRLTRTSPIASGIPARVGSWLTAIGILCVGMGVTLIQRRVFEEMIERGVARKKRGNYPANIRKSVYGFFDPIWLEHREEFLSEDLSFCHRWTQDCGGEVLACVDTPVGHVGQFIYTGVFLEKLRQDKKKGR